MFQVLGLYSKAWCVIKGMEMNFFNEKNILWNNGYLSMFYRYIHMVVSDARGH